jgi:peptide/nickel transport system substrate-binding protein
MVQGSPLGRSLAALAFALIVPACTPSGTAGGSATAGRNGTTVAHTLRIGEYQDLSGLNPHIVASTSLGNLSQLTMAYLVRYDEHNRPVPELATEVPTQKNGGVSRDGRTITWHLRKGVRWSDGAPFDADDVVFSTNAVNNPRNNEIGRDGWDAIVKIDEPDKYTVVFHLKHPYSGYLPSFFGSAGANPCILPKHILGDLPDFNNAPYNSKPVGIGPFRYVSWKRGDRVELEANPYYWRGLPKLKRIVMRFVPDTNTLYTQLRTGEIDLWPSISTGFRERVAEIPTVKLIRHPSYYFADPAVRRALRLATNRVEIVDKINNHSGIVQESQITPVSALASDIPLAPFDLAEANRVLDDAGWTRGADGIRAKNGVRLSFNYASTTGTPDADRRIESIRATWKQIGVTFEVHRYQPALFFAPFANGGIIFGGKWDVTSFSWGQTPDGDYSPTNACNQIPPHGENVTRLCDPKIDALIVRAKAAYDEEDRKPILRDLAVRVSELVPYFVLYIREDIHAYSRDLQNWKPNSSTPFDDFMNVDI